MSELNINTFGVIHQIWNEKEWKFPTPDAKNSAFDNLCEMFQKLNAEEQELLVNLMRCYSYYSYTDYQALLIKAFLKIKEQQIINVDRLVIAPLVQSKDIDNNKTKSGHNLTYPADTVAIRENKVLNNIERTVLQNPLINRDKISGDKILVILLDDFIGSGKSAVRVVQQVRNNLTAKDEIVIVSLLVMQKGLDNLANVSIPLYWAELVPKGIENNQFIIDKYLAYKLIDKIWENYLDISKKYKRGYEKSEALVTLLRTPNNTLPMYWCEKSRDGSDWPSPFTR